MSAVERFLLAVNNNNQEAVQICERTARKLESKEVKLVDVVQSLGEYLTNDDATLRARSVAYFAGVVGALDQTFLTRQQIAICVQFFGDRIQDASGLKEAVEGLQALQRLSRFTPENAVQVATALFTGAQDLQQHPQGTRYAALILLDSLLSKYRTALKGTGEDFVIGITDLVSGEKDPRNLMVTFSMLRVVMVEWDISNHVGTMFDSVFCYFPITFRPPPDDPYGITAKDLKSRLRDCIASTSLLAGHAFPALLDKLDSTSPNVKKDVLQTITACAHSYTPEAVANYSTQLWDSLKYEILQAQEEDLAFEALHAIRAIAECLSSGLNSTGAQTPLARYLRQITIICNKQLQEPQQKQARPAGQILSSVATASPIAFMHVIKAVVAPLLTVYQDAEGFGKQRALLEVLNRLLESALTVYGQWGSLDPYPDLINPLEAFKDRLYEMYTSALMGAAKEEVSFRMVALKGLVDLSKLRKYLSDEEIGMVVQYLDEILLDEAACNQDELRGTATHGLIEISKIKPDIIINITFPAFMAKLPDIDDQGRQEHLLILESLAKLSIQEPFFDLLLRRLLNKLDIVLQHTQSPIYPRAILSTLPYALSRRDFANDPKLDTYFEKLVIDLIRKAVQPAPGEHGFPVWNDESVLHVVGKLANTVTRALPPSKQREVLDKMDILVTGLDPGQMSKTTEPDYRRSVVLSTYITAGIRREVVLTPDVASLFKSTIQLALYATDSPSRAGYLIQVALIANKWLSSSQSEVVRDASSTLLRHLSGEISSDPGKDQQQARNNSLRILLWLTKALVLRSDPLSNYLLDHILALLAHQELGLPTARGFSILLGPHELLSKENFAIIRLLHKQRVFAYCVPKIASEFQRADTNTKTNHLIALAGILKYVPTDVIMPQLDVLLPLLLQSVDLAEAEVKAATIATLTVIVKENPKAVESHVSSLIGRLLGSASGGDVAKSQRARIAALQCLQLFPKAFRHELLVPHRKKVVKSLITSLDDPKREVRKEAVDCRSAWLRMDEQDEE